MIQDLQKQRTMYDADPQNTAADTQSTKNLM